LKEILLFGNNQISKTWGLIISEKEGWRNPTIQKGICMNLADVSVNGKKRN